MDQLLYLLGPLGCAAMMAIAAVLITRSARRPPERTERTDDEVSALREEVARLRAERTTPADG